MKKIYSLYRKMFPCKHLKYKIVWFDHDKQMVVEMCKNCCEISKRKVKNEDAENHKKSKQKK